MKGVLAVQKEELKVANKKTQDMMGKLEVGAKEAEIQKGEAQKIEEETSEDQEASSAYHFYPHSKALLVQISK